MCVKGDHKESEKGTGEGVLLGSEGGEECVLIFLSYSTRDAKYCSMLSIGGVVTVKSNHGEVKKSMSLLSSLQSSNGKMNS